MKVKLIRGGGFVDVRNLVIEVGNNTSFRITKNNENRLVITKVNDDDDRINVHPLVSNKLELF